MASDKIRKRHSVTRSCSTHALNIYTLNSYHP